LIVKIDLQEIVTAKRVLEVQLASYQIEADIIGFYELPPLQDTIDSLQKCDEIFYGYFYNDVLAGIIAFKYINQILDIHRVAVHPRYFRLGIAGQLISFVEEIVPDLHKVVVCTGKANLLAVQLHLQNGYQKVRDIQIANNLTITEFEKYSSVANEHSYLV